MKKNKEGGKNQYLPIHFMLCLYLIIIIFYVLIQFEFYHLAAALSSPPFSRQEILDRVSNKMDWKSFSPDDSANCGGINSESNNVNSSIAELTGDEDYKDNNEYLTQLENKRIEISQLLTDGKISESQYGILDKKIFDYEQKAKASS
jgi:hypothetical protein